jgi:hypothetical protein
MGSIEGSQEETKSDASPNAEDLARCEPYLEFEHSPRPPEGPDDDDNEDEDENMGITYERFLSAQDGFFMPGI